VDSLLRVQVPGLSGVVAVTAGMTHSLVLKSDGTVWGWGANSFSGQLGDGTLVERWTPVQTTGLAAVTALSTGGQHSLVIVGGASIGGLIAMVQGASMAPGIASAMLVKLEAAEDAVADGNINAACGQLGAFASQVRGQSGRSLAVELGNRLLAATRGVQGTLGCRAG